MGDLIPFPNKKPDEGLANCNCPKDARGVPLVQAHCPVHGNRSTGVGVNITYGGSALR